MTATYALPSKKGFAQLLEGWKITSIVTVQSALPWGVIGSRGNDPSGIAEFVDTWNFLRQSRRLQRPEGEQHPVLPSGHHAASRPRCISSGHQQYRLHIESGATGISELCVAAEMGLLRGGQFGDGASGHRQLRKSRPECVPRQWHSLLGRIRHEGVQDPRAVHRSGRIEVFNLLNTILYGNPQFNGAGGNDPFGTPGAFGASAATPDVLNNNPSLGSGGPREFQFGLNLLF